MRILCLYPGMSKQHDENIYALFELARRGHQLSVIASRSLGLKGRGVLPARENINGIPVFRLYRNLWDAFYFPQRKSHELLEIVASSRPDLIFCSQELNMRVALLLKKYISVPIVLNVEDAGRIANGQSYSSIRSRLTLAAVRAPSGSNFWRWLIKRVDSVITCHPRDRFRLKELSFNSTPCFFVPWCSHRPTLFKPKEKVLGRGIYVGSLYPFKNSQEFKITLPMILEKTSTEEFIVVGSGPLAKLVRKLQRKYKGRLRYISGMSRIEALELISSSEYGYTPVKVGGWGFVLDCWAAGTPVIMTHNDGFVSPMSNAMVTEIRSLSNTIQLLLENHSLQRRLQRNGGESYLTHSPETVGSNMQLIFERALRGPQILDFPS